jgi:hypothetical protein
VVASSWVISHVNAELKTNISELSLFCETLIFNLMLTEPITQGVFSIFAVEASYLTPTDPLNSDKN